MALPPIAANSNPAKNLIISISNYLFYLVAYIEILAAPLMSIVALATF